MVRAPARPASAASVSKMKRCIAVQPAPPCSRGQCGASQRARSFACQGMAIDGGGNRLSCRSVPRTSSGVKLARQELAHLAKERGIRRRETLEDHARRPRSDGISW